MGMEDVIGVLMLAGLGFIVCMAIRLLGLSESKRPGIGGRRPEPDISREERRLHRQEN